MEQKKEIKSNFCAAAKRYPTKGKAFEAFNNDPTKNGVYLVEEIVNGQIKHIPYGRCCNSVQDNELCHIHENQRKKEKSSFLYFDKDIKNKCDNQKIKKATASMSYFKQMGDRGRNKATKTTYHDFKNEDDPILKILKMDKNPRILQALRLHAIQLLNSQNIAVKPEKEEVKVEKNKVSKNKELLDTIQRLNIEHEKTKKENNQKIEDSLKELESDSEDSLNINENDDENNDENDDENGNDNLSIQTIEDEINEKQSNHDEESDDEGYDVEEIFTNKGKLLYLIPESMSVAEPEGENGGECIGTLTKIDKKYHTIKKDNCFYTVISENKVFYEDTEYFRDVMNNRIFDSDFVFKGRVTKRLDTDEYKFHFD